jgi:hypothetical protein
MNDNDSSGVQSDVWGTRARDLAEIEDESPRLLFQVILDEGSRLLFQVILDAASVGKDTKLLTLAAAQDLPVQWQRD